MNVNEQTGTMESDLADLGQVRLADLQVTDDAISEMLRRIVPDTLGRVPVAAFNSSI
jgi:FXSXX-COOH protein